MPGSLRDRLVDAVLSGEKTATTSLLVEWEADRDPLPEVGERQTGDADLSLARDEGEGFKTVSEWRREHERFWRELVIPRLSAPLAGAPTDDTRIVVERFRLVKRT